MSYGKPVDWDGLDPEKVDPDWLRLRDTDNRDDIRALMVSPRVIVAIIDAALDGMRHRRMPKVEK